MKDGDAHAVPIHPLMQRKGEGGRDGSGGGGERRQTTRTRMCREKRSSRQMYLVFFSLVFVLFPNEFILLEHEFGLVE